MKTKILITVSAAFMLLTLSSWGDVGHSMISFRINVSFNEEMEQFNDWIFYLSEHASDADWRKKDDPEEGPKHYIDIDNYALFVNEGYIPQSLETCIDTYGEKFVDDNGYLPWATLAMYDSVVVCMQRGDWANAKRYAADLGHYVADGHMPMHITRNYDGQFTGNTGIHARYEIHMIGRYQDQISYSGTPATAVVNVADYIFGYIYDNYTYMDSILIADDYAKEMGSGTGTDLYYVALWERTENLTNVLFSKASNAIAELLYTAWIEAGRPSENDIETGAAAVDKLQEADTFLNIAPNPVRSDLLTGSSSLDGHELSASVYDHTGRLTLHVQSPAAQPGEPFFALNTSSVLNGSYILVLENGSSRISAPFIILR
ncbi:MAG: hypothetical protein K9H15_16435 [Bacteroidales bacterium]|nr:hypothetical protein [Bacteroidales bacterium]